MPRALFIPLLAAAFALAPVSALADRDAVQFGDDIHVSAGSPVKDAVCFFCSVDVDGDVNGDIVVFFGKIRLDGKAHRDVVNFFGGITAADNSSIERDMVVFFGPVHLGENVSVSRNIVVFFGTLYAPASVSVGRDRFVQPPWGIALPPLVLILIVLVIVRESRASRRRQFRRGYPYPPQP